MSEPIDLRAVFTKMSDTTLHLGKVYLTDQTSPYRGAFFADSLGYDMLRQGVKFSTYESFTQAAIDALNHIAETEGMEKPDYALAQRYVLVPRNLIGPA